LTNTQLFDNFVHITPSRKISKEFLLSLLICGEESSMPLDGLQLGRYRLLHLLGAGGMGEVYLAEDTPIMRQVAIKVIKSYGMPYPGALTTDDVNRLFLREARAIAALQHPYILSLFDYGDVAVEGGTLSYMVMPYCQEGSLEAWLLRRGSSHLPSLHLIALILEQAADALQYAHEKQIIHQDVKLSNFLIHRWRALSIPDLLLADFGIAKFLSTHSRTSQSIRSTISLYVNRQLIQQVQDGTFMQGQVGVVVYQGEAIFGSAKIWAL